MQAKGERVVDYPLPYGKQAPLFPAILREMFFLGIDPQKGGIILNIICSVTLCGVVWSCCRHLGINDFWSLFSAFLVGVHPELVRCSHELQRESIYLLFEGITIYMVIVNILSASPRERFLSALGFGSAGAIAVATRYEALELLVISLVCHLYVIVQKKQYALRYILERAMYLFTMTASWLITLIIVLRLSNYPALLFFKILISHLKKIE